MESLNLTQPQFCACANLRQAARAITQFYAERFGDMLANLAEVTAVTR